VAWVVVGLFLAGCGSGDNLVSVSGKVTFQGNPVANAQLVFKPVGTGQNATAMTDSSGNYSLRAAPGRYKVSVTVVQASGPAIDASNPSADYGKMMMAAAQGQPAQPASATQPGGIPAKYANPETSGLEVEVPKGPYNFSLTE